MLMETFSDALEDDGTQEAVCSVLATAPADVRVRAILEGLARLRRDAPSWAPCLVEGETRSNPDLVVKIANEVPRDVREILTETLRRSIDDGARGAPFLRGFWSDWNHPAKHRR
jgi:hypothetical protein